LYTVKQKIFGGKLKFPCFFKWDRYQIDAEARISSLHPNIFRFTVFYVKYLSVLGLFAGLLFFVVTITSIAIYCIYDKLNQIITAVFVFNITFIGLFITTSFACIFAIRQMRNLSFFLQSGLIILFIYSIVIIDNPKQERVGQLDRLLIFIGMIGEIVLPIASLIGLIGSEWNMLTTTMLLVNICRFTQVII
jgi:hypothetical protein